MRGEQAGDPKVISARPVETRFTKNLTHAILPEEISGSKQFPGQSLPGKGLFHESEHGVFIHLEEIDPWGVMAYIQGGMVVVGAELPEFAAQRIVDCQYSSRRGENDVQLIADRVGIYADQLLCLGNSDTVTDC